MGRTIKTTRVNTKTNCIHFHRIILLQIEINVCRSEIYWSGRGWLIIISWELIHTHSILGQKSFISFFLVQQICKYVCLTQYKSFDGLSSSYIGLHTLKAFVAGGRRAQKLKSSVGPKSADSPSWSWQAEFSFVSGVTNGLEINYSKKLAKKTSRGKNWEPPEPEFWIQSEMYWITIRIWPFRKILDPDDLY